MVYVIYIVARIFKAKWLHGWLDNEQSNFKNIVSKVLITYMECLANDEMMFPQLRLEYLLRFDKLSVYQRGND